LIAKSIENFSEAVVVFGEKGEAGGYACWRKPASEYLRVETEDKGEGF